MRHAELPPSALSAWLRGREDTWLHGYAVAGHGNMPATSSAAMVRYPLSVTGQQRMPHDHVLSCSR